MIGSNMLRRPVTVADMVHRWKYFMTEKSLRQGLSFQPRMTDIFISPYPKCGTTWVQQIIHGLRTRGSMNFDDITEAVPWLEMAFDLGIDLHVSQAAQPRAFKSHLNWYDIPKGGRYIYVVRDPKDVLVSYFRFLEGWHFETGSISISDFARQFFMANREFDGYWHHLASWWQHRSDPNILLLAYEDLQGNLNQLIRIIADFIDCQLDEDLLDLVTRQSSIEFMRLHQQKFDMHLVRETRDEACGIPPHGNSSGVRKGRVGEHLYELPPLLSKELDAIWHEDIESRFGLASYQALREEVAQSQVACQPSSPAPFGVGAG